MVTNKTWDEFRNTGLLWFVNTILHAFGWAICLNVDDDGNIIESYPAKVKYRGFASDLNSAGYIRLAEYMRDNGRDILNDIYLGDEL